MYSRAGLELMIFLPSLNFKNSSTEGFFFFFKLKLQIEKYYFIFQKEIFQKQHEQNLYLITRSNAFVFRTFSMTACGGLIVLAIVTKSTSTGTTQNSLVYQSFLKTPLSRQAATAKFFTVQKMSMTPTAISKTVCT